MVVKSGPRETCESRPMSFSNPNVRSQEEWIPARKFNPPRRTGGERGGRKLIPRRRQNNFGLARLFRERTQCVLRGFSTQAAKESHGRKIVREHCR